MKKILIASTIVLFIASCGKEQIPNGLDLNASVSKDTTYVAATATPQLKNVLIEEVTGVRCIPCVNANDIIEQMMLTNPARIVATGIHHSLLQSNPLPESKQDFRTAEGDQLSDFLGTFSSKPSACINRLPTTSGQMYNDTRTTWQSFVTTYLAQSTPINIDISTSTFTDSIDIKTKVSFTNTVSGNIRLTVYIIENKIDDAQETPTGLVENYELNHVFRKMVSPIAGKAVLDSLSTKAPGRVFETTMRMKPQSTWVKANCKVVCIVHKEGTSKEVLQVKEISL